MLVKGILTAEKGIYSFDNIYAGNYLISVTHTGINTAYGKVIEVNDKTKEIDMGTIHLEDSSTVLADVTIVNTQNST